VRIAFACVGRLKDGPERALYDRYAVRIEQIGRAVGFTRLDLFEIDEGRARSAEERKKSEAAALDAALGAEFRRIALDERGKPLTTDAFTTYVRAAQDSGVRGFALIIGGADGLDRSFADGADLKLSFGGMTLPHQLVRVLAAEQMYRVATILAGHPYNRT
jgi:23S rRNA (pseudouridine1915-N3)-methyltransferase